MEYVVAAPFNPYSKQLGQTDKEQRFAMMAAGIIRLLRGLPAPSDAIPGPYTTSPDKAFINHMIFKDQIAPTVYSDVAESEAHLNRVLAKGLKYRDKDPPVVRLDTKLVFCHTDFNDENYLFDTHNGRLRLHMIDFEHSSFLPIDFFAFAILMDGDWGAEQSTGRSVGIPARCLTNMPLMGEIQGIFTVYVPTVGQMSDRALLKHEIIQR
ncbi:hypothetical protein B0H63DRAFT_474823 [Podospora didyma]|uniref:Aminoglycoside phosphotransferase domain-containing protein n=1 Tax=Podospora didyma TaxID=330526 RepID=A0AAE0NGG9_9PEZI|nr:hypothetical protein B0H63DRAFT_474823 [Podospora didyma]